VSGRSKQNSRWLRDTQAHHRCTEGVTHHVCARRLHAFLVRLQFVVYDLTKIYTPGGRNESGANANQSLT